MGSKNNSWMSFSDLMTGLMVIFMFVAISYILEVQKAEQQRQKVVTDFQDSKSAIYKDLRSAFDEEKKEWEMEIGKDLSIRFTNPQVIFALGKSDVTPTFQKILNDFLPRYFNILLKEEYRTRIKEILLSKFTGSEISLLVAINNVVTDERISFGRSSHRPSQCNHHTRWKTDT